MHFQPDSEPFEWQHSPITATRKEQKGKSSRYPPLEGLRIWLEGTPRGKKYEGAAKQGRGYLCGTHPRG